MESHRHAEEGNPQHKLLGKGEVLVDLEEIGPRMEVVLRDFVAKIRECERRQFSGAASGRKSSTTGIVDSALDRISKVLRSGDRSAAKKEDAA